MREWLINIQCKKKLNYWVIKKTHTINWSSDDGGVGGAGGGDDSRVVQVMMCSCYLIAMSSCYFVYCGLWNLYTHEDETK